MFSDRGKRFFFLVHNFFFVFWIFLCASLGSKKRAEWVNHFGRERESGNRKKRWETTKRWMTEWMFKSVRFCQGWWHKEYILWLYKIKVSIFLYLQHTRTKLNAQLNSLRHIQLWISTHSSSFDSTLQCCMHSRWINNNNNQVSTFVDRTFFFSHTVNVDLIRMWQCALMEALWVCDQLFFAIFRQAIKWQRWWNLVIMHIYIHKWLIFSLAFFKKGSSTRWCHFYRSSFMWHMCV